MLLITPSLFQSILFVRECVYQEIIKTTALNSQEIDQSIPTDLHVRLYKDELACSRTTNQAWQLKRTMTWRKGKSQQITNFAF